jgi:hypothetical protein
MPVKTPSSFNIYIFLVEMKDNLLMIQCLLTDVAGVDGKRRDEVALEGTRCSKTERLRADMSFRMECEAIGFGILKKY